MALPDGGGGRGGWMIVLVEGEFDLGERGKGKGERFGLVVGIGIGDVPGAGVIGGVGTGSTDASETITIQTKPVVPIKIDRLNIIPQFSILVSLSPFPFSLLIFPPHRNIRSTLNRSTRIHQPDFIP